MVIKGSQVEHCRIGDIVSSGPSAFIVADSDRCIKFINFGAELVFGYGRQEAPGRLIEVLLPSLFEDSSDHNVKSFLDDPGPCRSMKEPSELHGVRKDGTEFLAEISITKLELAGEMHFAAKVRDVSLCKSAAKDVCNAERMLQSAVDNTTVSGFRTNEAGLIASVSASVADWLGCSANELIGKEFASLFVHRSCYDNFFADLAKCGGEISGYQIIMLRKGGSKIWVSMDSRIIRDANRSFVGIEGGLREISDEIDFVDELRKNENRTNQMQRVPCLNSWKPDLSNDNRPWSDECCRIFKARSRRLLPSRENYLNATHAAYRASINQAYPNSIPNQASNEIVRRFQMALGRLQSVHEYREAGSGNGGKPLVPAGVVQNAASAAERDRVEALLASATNAVPAAMYCLFNSDDRLVSCSPQYRELYGTALEIVVPGASFEQLVRTFAAVVGVGKSEEEADAWIDNRLARRNGPALPYTYQFGGGEWVEAFDHVLEDGSILTILKVTSGIKPDEEQLFQAEKMRALGQLTSGIAHDFNNLLAVIRGSAELLSEKSTSNKKFVEAILNSSTRGAELTQRLLSFSRQKALKARPIDLAKLVLGMDSILKRTLGEGIVVETVAKEDRVFVLADFGQVENALLNMAINARDAMREGGQLTIECRNVDMDKADASHQQGVVGGDYGVLVVSDGGVGMSPEVRARVFEPFFTTKRAGKGSGLGLSMIHDFAERSGGYIDICSEEGHGTTVSLYLPRAGEGCRQRGGRQSASIAKGQGEVILVIEDDDGVRNSVVVMLKTLGYKVVTASNAESARSVLGGKEKVDLVLSDVALPDGLSGPEFAQDLRRDNPNLPFVFMSGYSEEAAIRSGNLGSDQVLLNKPFEKVRLAKELRYAFDQ